jgi:hypothetical protein
LLDLSENNKTLAHMLQWEGDKSQKISHFLCTLWRDEERDIGVPRDENGIILGKKKSFGNFWIGRKNFSH